MFKSSRIRFFSVCEKLSRGQCEKPRSEIFFLESEPKLLYDGLLTYYASHYIKETHESFISKIKTD